MTESDAVCADIVRHLVNHNGAADTARDIAEWWIDPHVGRTAEAFARLQTHGVVRSYLVQEATSPYVFTKNPIPRATPRQYVGGLPASTTERG